MAGILFFLIAALASTGTELDLARDLFLERNWAAAGREAERVLLKEPACEEGILIRAASRINLGECTETHIESLRKLAATAGDVELRCRAAYASARALWRTGDRPGAFALFRQTFLGTTDTDLSLHAACSLFLLLEEESSLEPAKSSLRMQINTTRWIWYGSLFGDCRIRRRDTTTTGLLSIPGRLVTWLYRRGVAPALGQRCSLTPSCSEYFKVASEQHGLLGFPIVADRFFREPGVVKDAQHPTYVGGKLRYADPLSDHDAWLTAGRSQRVRRMFHKEPTE